MTRQQQQGYRSGVEQDATTDEDTLMTKTTVALKVGDRVITRDEGAFEGTIVETPTWTTMVEVRLASGNVMRDRSDLEIVQRGV